MANCGAHGGCKNGAFWGHVNYVDHSTAPGYHVDSTEITGYLMDAGSPTARDICGIARTNLGKTVRFRVRLIDNGELHQPNPSTTGPVPPPDEFTMCGGLAAP